MTENLATTKSTREILDSLAKNLSLSHFRELEISVKEKDREDYADPYYGYIIRFYNWSDGTGQWESTEVEVNIHGDDMSEVAVSLRGMAFENVPCSWDELHFAVVRWLSNNSEGFKNKFKEILRIA